jgi:glucose-1-phosphate cytidylyltransferase
VLSMMPVGILAGGLGTRLSEETVIKPKPMVEIGGLPILWHILKYYSGFGAERFLIALGYKGEVIKEFFLKYRLHTSDLSVQLRQGEVTFDRSKTEEWRVDLLDTGLATQTGGRVKRLLERAGSSMLLTYGDGVADVDIGALVAFHRSHGRLATVTAVRPPARFGMLELKDELVARFAEKPQAGEGWINGGFFVLEPGVVDYIAGDDTVFEREPLERLAAEGQLSAFRHEGFWQCMDTLRDVRQLDELWRRGIAPWCNWTR